MDFSLIVNALHFAIMLALPAIVGVLAAAVLAGLLQAATQISDSSIGFASRLLGVGIAIYFYSGPLSQELFQYSARLWGGVEFYR